MAAAKSIAGAEFFHVLESNSMSQCVREIGRTRKSVSSSPQALARWPFFHAFKDKNSMFGLTSSRVSLSFFVHERPTPKVASFQVFFVTKQWTSRLGMIAASSIKLLMDAQLARALIMSLIGRNSIITWKTCGGKTSAQASRSFFHSATAGKGEAIGHLGSKIRKPASRNQGISFVGVSKFKSKRQARNRKIGIKCSP